MLIGMAVEPLLTPPDGGCLGRCAHLLEGVYRTLVFTHAGKIYRQRRHALLLSHSEYVLVSVTQLFVHCDSFRYKYSRNIEECGIQLQEQKRTRSRNTDWSNLHTEVSSFTTQNNKDTAI